jgi:hypothetical protein
MTAEGMITEIIQCFVPPPRPMIEKMKAFAEKIPDDCRQEVIDRILETEGPSSKVGVKQMVESCAALGVGFKRSHFLPTIDWYCDACGYTFKYAQAVSDDDRIDKGLHDFCPMCGFQPIWTTNRDAYMKMGALSEAYAKQYADQVQKATDKHGMNPKFGQGPEGVYWSRSKAELERKANSS